MAAKAIPKERKSSIIRIIESSWADFQQVEGYLHQGTCTSTNIDPLRGSLAILRDLRHLFPANLRANV